MRHIIFFILLSNFLVGQTLVDSAAENIGKLIYASDGIIIGKDSIYRKTYLYEENGKEIFTYVDSLIMRISFQDIEASVWYSNGSLYDDALFECASDCGSQYMVYDQGYESGYIYTDKSGGYIQVKEPGYYRVSYSGTLINNSGDVGNFNIQVSKINNKSDTYLNTRSTVIIGKDYAVPIHKENIVYVGADDKLYLFVESTLTTYQFLNYSLTAKRIVR